MLAACIIRGRADFIHERHVRNMRIDEALQYFSQSLAASAAEEEL
jgi:hypothetical protein